MKVSVSVQIDDMLFWSLLSTWKIEAYSYITETILFVLQRKPVIPNTLQNVTEESDVFETWSWLTVSFVKAEMVGQPSWSNLFLKYRRQSLSIYTQMTRVDEKINLQHWMSTISYFQF